MNIYKINNKIMVSGFGLLALLVLGVAVIPAQTHAQYYEDLGYHNPTGPSPSGYYSGTGGSYGGGSYYQAPTYYYTQPAPVTPTYIAPTPTVYSNTTNPNQTSNTKTVTKAKTTDTTNTAATDTSKLAANAVFGSDSFMPSGIIQWILFAILVLLVVILVRKLYGGSEKYHATPLKHD